MTIKSLKLLASIKNAATLGQQNTTVELNNFTLRILDKLYKEGYILGYKKITCKGIDKAQVYISTSTTPNYSPLANIVIYIQSTRSIGVSEIAKLCTKGRFGVVSTSQGLLTLDECKKKCIGGVLLFVC